MRWPREKGVFDAVLFVAVNAVVLKRPVAEQRAPNPVPRGIEDLVTRRPNRAFEVAVSRRISGCVDQDLPVH